MGIAAYRRGSAVITRQIEADYALAEEYPGAAHIRARLDATPAGDVLLFQDTVARPNTGPEGGWLLMNRQKGGYGEYGVPFPTLDAIRRKFAVVFGAFGRDRHSSYWEILCVHPTRP